MTTITLDSIKAEQTKLAEMIATFEAQANASIEIHFPESLITLNQGEHYAGLITSKDGDPSHHLILLPGSAERINWADAKAWAKGQGGELPNRREQSLLFANLKDQFEQSWYWSNEAHASEPGWAWFQYFDFGGQNNLYQDYELRARAVRRLIIE